VIHGKSGLPHLFMVTSGKEQEMRITRMAAAFLADTPGLVIQTTTATRLADRGPLAAIWYQVPSDNKIPELASRSQFYHESHPQ